MINATIQLDGAQVSDLFFNSELTHYNGVFKPKGVEVTREEIKEALMNDAIEFSNFIGCQVSAETLCEDFLSRL